MEGQIPSELTGAQLQCSLVGHSWEEANPLVRGVTSIFENVLTWECVRCLKVRVDAFDNRGNLMQRRYRDPAWWVKMTRNERACANLRMAWVRQKVKKVSEFG